MASSSTPAPIREGTDEVLDEALTNTIVVPGFKSPEGCKRKETTEIWAAVADEEPRSFPQTARNYDQRPRAPAGQQLVPVHLNAIDAFYEDRFAFLEKGLELIRQNAAVLESTSVAEGSVFEAAAVSLSLTEGGVSEAAVLPSLTEGNVSQAAAAVSLSLTDGSVSQAATVLATSFTERTVLSHAPAPPTVAGGRVPVLSVTGMTSRGDLVFGSGLEEHEVTGQRK